MQYYQSKGVAGVDIDDIYLGNGVSELIVMSMQALLNNGDEVLIPAPDYPLWTAAVSLCRRHAGALPVRRAGRLVSGPGRHRGARSRPAPRRSWSSTRTTRPARCTRARCSTAIVELARRHDLVVCSPTRSTTRSSTTTPSTSPPPPRARPALPDLQRSVQGLSRGRIPVRLDGGVRPEAARREYIEGLDILANMRLCANVPAQHAIQTALGGYQSINDLVLPGGRLRRAARPRVGAAQRDPRRELRQAEGRAVRVPADRPEGLPDPRRREVRARPAAAGEDAGGAGHRLQLALAGSLPRSSPCPVSTIWKRRSGDSAGFWTDTARDQLEGLP